MPTYCNNSEYDYHYSAQPGSYWNDLQLLCRNFDASEMTHKEKDLAFVATIVKEVKVIKGAGMDECARCEGALPEQRVKGLEATDVYGARVCECRVQQDWFALGRSHLLFS